MIPDTVTELGDDLFEGSLLMQDRLAFYQGDIENAPDIRQELQGYLVGKTVFPFVWEGRHDDANVVDPKETFYGDWYVQMPPEMRKMNPREAEYAFMTSIRHQERHDYIGGRAENTITDLYLCGRDGSVAFLGSVSNSPPFSGVVMQGQALRGAIASSEQLWELIRNMFQE